MSLTKTKFLQKSSRIASSSNLLAVLLVTLWPFYQLSQLPQSLVEILGIRLYFYDFLVGIFLIINIKKLYSIPTHPFFTSFSLLVASLILSFPSPFYLLRFFSYSLLFFFFPITEQLKKAFFYSLFLIPILGLTQYLFLPDLRFLYAIGFDDHYYRLTFPFLDPNFTAAFLSVTILLSLKNIKNKLNLGLLTLSLPALALTFSRAGFLSLLAGLIFIACKKKSARLFIPLIFLALTALIFIIPKPAGEGVNLLRTFSIDSRLQNYVQNINLIVQNPITGLGFGSIRSIDSSLLYILVSAGAIGLATFVNLAIKIFSLNKNLYLQAVFVALFTHALFNNTLFYAPIILLIIFSLKLRTYRT